MKISLDTTFKSVLPPSPRILILPGKVISMTTPQAKLIAIEGIDGSGKGTQATLLHARLESAGRRSQLISFPRYADTFFGKAIGEFLNGKFGSLEEVPPFLVSLLYAGDRFESHDFLQSALESSEFVILDRYVASNIAHQGVKLLRDARTDLIRRIEHLEFEIYRLPQPTNTIFLDLPAVQAQELIARKQARNYTDQAADLQEADGQYLERTREVYLSLSESQPNWYRISCLDNDRLRTIEEIHEEIWELVTSSP